ncbi:MlaD family protein [Ornithobacterium rhinotracheale]|uniref:MlaD family protein n=1 Tax=Ornithobacterium rhinotracheale TaxID=28251 RepID=UPI00215982A7|nr:MlaD family protein [Ornithobacterium rhinotracheale]UVD86702.1 MlaD family protein [Ornithobacterium rhinotracheale]
MKISKEIKIGLISVVSIVLFYWLFNFLNGKNFFTSGQIYYAVYENVDGLLPTKPVNVNGLKVGTVEDIKIVEGKEDIYFVVKMILNKKLHFSKNTVAEIYEPGLMAGKQIKLNIDYNGPEAQSGDTLVAANTQSLMTMLSNKLQPTQNKLDSVLTTLNATLGRFGNLADEETNQNLKHVLASLDQTIQSLGATSNSARALIQSTTKIADKIDGEVKQLSQNANNVMSTANSTLKKYGDVADKIEAANFEKTLANLESSSQELKQFLTKLDNSNGTLNKLINDPAFYNNLNETTKSLNTLLTDLKERPDKYIQFSVFGKKVRVKDTIK